VAASARLLDAIERKLLVDSMSTLPPDQVDIIYPTAVLDKAYMLEDTFLRSFLLALPPRRLFFRYIALGIRL